MKTVEGLIGGSSLELRSDDWDYLTAEGERFFVLVVKFCTKLLVIFVWVSDVGSARGLVSGLWFWIC